jgi:hypothetical protein
MQPMMLAACTAAALWVSQAAAIENKTFHGVGLYRLSPAP